MSSKVPIYVSNRKAYIWSVEDVTELRVKHHICGTLVGTLPHLAQQNFFLGLPLLLMPEEVVLLIENEVAVLVDDSVAMRQPSAAELTEWDENRKREVTQQVQLWHEREKARLTLETAGRKGKGKLSEEAVRKRKERDARRVRNASLGTDENVMSSDHPAVPDSPSKPSTQSESQVQKQTYYTVHIPSTSTSKAWYQPSCHDNLASAKRANVWSYPHTQMERAFCKVFRHLLEKGYFLGTGVKFGGDFLVYPGDPLRYHSHFVASVLPSMTSAVRPMEIVAHGRLGTATKKAHLLCAWDEDKQEVSCFSIEWSGFG